MDGVSHLHTISIHTTRVGGDWGVVAKVDKWIISIHTTHVGGDRPEQNFKSIVIISIHTTHVGGDEDDTDNEGSSLPNFNPHHPCGWWPDKDVAVKDYIADFNPHHPCGWWLIIPYGNKFTSTNFNPHHPCGWWLKRYMESEVTTVFQSTPPVWVVTILG